MKRFQNEQEKIKQYKEFIAKFGHGTKKLARQAKSREKSMARMKDNGLTEKVVSDRVLSFLFPDCEDLPPPVLQFSNVDFAYPNKKDQKTKKLLFTNLDFGVDLDSRVALVGQNGAGKSTLLKLMVGDLTPVNGVVKRHQKLRIGWFHQHLSEKLDKNLSPLVYLIKEYQDNDGGEEVFRRLLGRYGVTGTTQTTPMGILSDGQKSRVVFAWLAWRQPQMLLLDEPTNHLDMETIDALADAINEYEGGVVLVSHDFRLINQVAEEIWECKNCSIKKYDGDIMSYKANLKIEVMKDINL
jgi:ATP-binding cassette subfamily F protein 2